jgi:type-F conjugative transfer system pilin assembly protein TrbC
LKFNCGKTLAELQKNNEQCNVSRVDINPNLFKVFDVKEVPAIAWTNLTYADLMGMKSLDSSQYGLIYGDVSVEHALQKFAEKLPIDTKPYMKKLKEGYFD